MKVRALLFLLVVGIGMFLSPIWVGYAVLGLGLGLGLRFIGRLFLSSRRFRLGVGLALLLGVVIVAFLTMSRSGVSQIFSTIGATLHAGPQSFQVSFLASVSPQPDATRWEIREEFQLSEADQQTLGLIPQAGSDSQSIATMAAEVRAQLKIWKWETAGFSGSRERFRRTREVTFRPDWFRATTNLAIPFPIAEFRIGAAEVTFLPDEKSSITLDLPKYLVVTTYPPCTGRIDALHDGLEKLTVPAVFSTFEEPEVRMSVLSPLLRWPLGPAIGSFSLWSGVEWVLFLVCALFSNRILDRILKPLVPGRYPGPGNAQLAAAHDRLFVKGEIEPALALLGEVPNEALAGAETLEIVNRLHEAGRSPEAVQLYERYLQGFPGGEGSLRPAETKPSSPDLPAATPVPAVPRIFISYRSTDKALAFEMVAWLEQRGLSCWIAPRDILPGRSFPTEIVAGLHSAGVFILLFTGTASLSRHILSEVGHAFDLGRPIIVFKTSPELPDETFGYFLKLAHWLEATGGPPAAHFPELEKALRIHLKIPAGPDQQSPE